MNIIDGDFNSEDNDGPEAYMIEVEDDSDSDSEENIYEVDYVMMWRKNGDDEINDDLKWNNKNNFFNNKNKCFS